MKKETEKTKEHHLPKDFLKDSILIVLGILVLTAFVIRFAELCIFDVYGIADKEAYRTVSISDTAEMRGTIYDANGNVLAYSTPTYNLVLSPYDIFENAKIEEQLEIIADNKSNRKDREKAETEIDNINFKAEKKANQLCHKLKNLFPDDIESATGLYNTLKSMARTEGSDLGTEIYADSEKLEACETALSNGNKYYIIIKQIDDKDKSKIESFIADYNNAVERENDAASKIEGNSGDVSYKIQASYDYFLEETQKRIYPYGSITGIVLGYVDKDGIARNGIEEYYDTILSGVADRRISGRGEGSIVTSVYDKTIAGQESASLNTTIDINIQKILVDAITAKQAETDAESVYGIVLNTKTGAILAMSNTPGYDSNDPETPLDSEVAYYTYLYENNLLEEETTTEEESTDEETTDETDAEETTTAETSSDNPLSNEPVLHGTLYERTRNRCVLDYYYPGSIYKTFLVSGALEEGLDISYYCGGSYEIPDSDMGNGTQRTISCANNKKHGVIDAESLLVNSCNVAAAQLGIDMQADLFFKYYEAFGFSDATGVDLCGGSIAPSSSIYYDETEYDSTSLATCSFGQNNAVSALQIAVAMSAIGNGGYIMTPYIVESTVDDDGNIISKTEPQVKRQAISEQTADKVAGYLKNVVEIGGGTRAKLDNYYVSGKTGTSSILDANEDVIGHKASFAGFAPTSDPEITVVISIIDPKNTAISNNNMEYLASQIAAPVAGEVLGKTLKYLSIPYDKTTS